MATEETKDSNITHGVQDVMKNINFNLEIETTKYNSRTRKRINESF